MGKETGKLTSHTSDGVLEGNYLDPTILNAAQKVMLNIIVFG